MRQGGPPGCDKKPHVEYFYYLSGYYRKNSRDSTTEDIKKSLNCICPFSTKKLSKVSGKYFRKILNTYINLIKTTDNILLCDGRVIICRNTY